MKNAIDAKTARKLRRVLDFIDQQTAVKLDMVVGIVTKTSNPEAAVFTSYCGTAGCLAGFTVLQRLWSRQRGATPLRKNALLRSPIFPASPHEPSDLGEDRDGVRWGSVKTAAVRILGLDDGSMYRLFYLHNWPLEFEGAYRRARSRVGRAKVLRERVEYFIEKGE